MNKVLIVDGYDIRTVVADILRKEPNIRETDDYESLKDLYIEYTMSCDKGEQVAWMKHYIHVGLQKLDHAASLRGQRSSWNSASGLEHEGFLDIIVAYDLI